MKFFVNLIVVSIISVSFVNSDRNSCEVIVKTFVGIPIPFLINRAKTQILQPSKDTGLIKINKNEIVYLGCPGDKNYLRGYKEQQLVEISCLGENKFSVKGIGSRDFEEFLCLTVPKSAYESIRDDGYCPNNVYFKVGFKLKPYFLTQYQVCYDATKEVPIFTVYDMGPYVNLRGSYFEPQDNTFSTFEWTTGKVVNPSKSYNDHKAFDRGHIAADKDFFFEAQHLATRYYFNVAPQWQKLNNGKWRCVENSIRAYSSEFARPNVRIISGVHGILDDNLYLDKKNNKVAVPKFFWKAIFESNKGLAFVAFNGQGVISTTIKDKLKAVNICSQYQWVNTDMGDYITCCSFANLYTIFGITTGLPISKDTPTMEKKDATPKRTRNACDG